MSGRKRRRPSPKLRRAISMATPRGFRATQPTCHGRNAKVRFPTEAPAAEAIAYLTATKHGEKRYYRCRTCGGWHLTSQEQRGAG